MTTATLTKKDLNRIPQMLSNIPEQAIITINILLPMEASLEFQQSEKQAYQFRHSNEGQNRIQQEWNTNRDWYNQFAS